MPAKLRVYLVHTKGHSPVMNGFGKHALTRVWNRVQCRCYKKSFESAEVDEERASSAKNLAATHHRLASVGSTVDEVSLLKALSSSFNLQQKAKSKKQRALDSHPQFPVHSVLLWGRVQQFWLLTSLCNDITTWVDWVAGTHTSVHEWIVWIHVKPDNMCEVRRSDESSAFLFLHI